MLPKLDFGTRAQPVSSIFEWLRLFGTYAAVFLAARPTLAPSMMTYMVRIVDLNKKYGGWVWREYDIRFRQMKAVVAREEDLPWHKTEVTALLDCVHAFASAGPAPRSAQQPFRAQQQGRSKTNVCYDYNNQDGCQREHCRYRHACSTCRKEGHTSKNCSPATRPSTSNATGQARSKQPSSGRQQAVPNKRL
jgi:hypothetical protein